MSFIEAKRAAVSQDIPFFKNDRFAEAKRIGSTMAQMSKLDQVMKFKQARVRGESNYDSLKDAKCLCAGKGRE